MHGTMDVPVKGGSHMATQHDKQFKLDATRYYEDHKDLGLRGVQKTSVSDIAR